jgi:hypothetical protein
MNCDYEDIRRRIPFDPQWFDESAVPRYITFGPAEVSNIYAREAALVEIACQSCQRHFHVAFSRSSMDDVRDQVRGRPSRLLADIIKEKTIHYGDPPNIRCCPAGPTMNSDPLRVLEYWRRDETTDHEWRRDQSLEIDVSDEELGADGQSGP